MNDAIGKFGPAAGRFLIALIFLLSQARLGAAALFLWMIPVTLVFHNFWAAAADQQQVELAMFMKNIAMMGGLLYIMAYGSGRFSVKA